MKHGAPKSTAAQPNAGQPGHPINCNCAPPTLSLPAGYNLTGSIFVASRYLSTTYLWDKIRVQGGAYGAGASFDLTSGIWMYCSWRDPTLLATVDAFDSEPPAVVLPQLPNAYCVCGLKGSW